MDTEAFVRPFHDLLGLGIEKKTQVVSIFWIQSLFPAFKTLA